MEETKNPKKIGGTKKTQSAPNKNPTMQGNNNISSYPSKDDLNTPEKEVIEEDTREYSISFFDNVTSKVPKERKLSFEEILKYFNEAVIRPFSRKENLEAMICGSFSKPQRASEYLVSRSIIAYDIDNFKGNFDELLALIKNSHIANKTFIYYTTTSSSYTKPRIRLMLFISKDIEASHYNKIAQNIAYEWFPEELRNAIDKSSYSPMQLMFLPNKRNDEFKDEFKCGKNIGHVFDANEFLEGYYTDEIITSSNNEAVKEPYSVNLEETDFDSLSKELISYHKNLPLDISQEKIDETLQAYDCNQTDYYSWFMVCQAIHHQFKGGEEGLEVFTKWSLTDTRYNQDQIKRECRDKYYSLKRKTDNPVTFATIIKLVNNKKKEALREDLREKIEKLPEYFEEKDVRSLINTLAQHFTHIEAENYLQKIRNKTNLGISKLKKILTDESNKIEHVKSKASTGAYPLCKKLPSGVFIDFYGNGIPKGTYENFSILLEKYGIDIRYNLISKDMDYLIPGVSHTKDNAGEAYYADIISICERNNITDLTFFGLIL